MNVDIGWLQINFHKSEDVDSNVMSMAKVLTVQKKEKTMILWVSGQTFKSKIIYHFFFDFFLPIPCVLGGEKWWCIMAANF